MMCIQTPESCPVYKAVERLAQRNTDRENESSLTEGTEGSFCAVAVMGETGVLGVVGVVGVAGAVDNGVLAETPVVGCLEVGKAAGAGFFLRFMVPCV